MPHKGVTTPAEAMRTGGATYVMSWIGEGRSTQSIAKDLGSLYPNMSYANRLELVSRLRGARKAAVLVEQGRYRSRDISKYAAIAYSQSKQWRYWMIYHIKDLSTGDIVNRYLRLESSHALSVEELRAEAARDYEAKRDMARLLRGARYPTNLEFEGATVFGVSRRS